MNFELSTPQKIIFGAGRLNKLGQLVKPFGSHALVLSGLDQTKTSFLVDLLSQENIQSSIHPVTGEPTDDSINAAVDLARKRKVEFVIGFGGGSALDTAKAVAILSTNPGELSDYLEVIGRGLPLTQPGIPFIAIPTTAGTGSESTKNAVIQVLQKKTKVSLRSDRMLAKLALIDPDLTISLPPRITADTGLDALTQVIEPYVCNNPNPVTDSFCREGMQRASKSLRKSFTDGNDREARSDMCIASLMGGLALANARLGAVHGFAGPIGGMFAAPHGAVCARLLPFTMEMNIRALEERDAANPALERYRQIASYLTGDLDALPLAGVEWVYKLCQDLQVAPLATFGVSREYIPEIVEKASQASSMKGNPLELTREELTEILHLAI